MHNRRRPAQGDVHTSKLTMHDLIKLSLTRLSAEMDG